MAKSNQMGLLSNIISMFRPKRKRGLQSVADTFKAAERGLNVDLRNSSNREVVETRQLVVNVIMLGRNMTPTELHRELTSAGITGTGLSRRSLAFYKSRHEDAINGKTDEVTRYALKYRRVAEAINESFN
jgi:hypothetical protein